MKMAVTVSIFCAFILGPPLCNTPSAFGAEQFRVRDLGTLRGGAFSQATFVDGGLITGLSNTKSGSQHAVLWFRGGARRDIGKNGLGGPNSGAFGVNRSGQVVGQAESSEADPNDENFCDYGTGLKCLPFAWQFGEMIALPTLGGNNGTVGPISNRGRIPGVAENATVDPDCPKTVAVNGTGPQVLDFEPVVWRAKPKTVKRLRLLSGDTVGIAFWLNEHGQAVGTTGSCANTIVPPFAIGPHAVMWGKDGSVHDLGNLGGTANPNLLGIGNVAFAINDKGQVTGLSVLPGDTTVHAFRWTEKHGMQDLGVLEGDTNSAGLGINNLGEIVGSSIAGDVATGFPRAMLWRNGAMADLNALATDSPLYLLTAFAIDDRERIVGFGVDNDGEVHGFLASPADTVAEANPGAAAAERPTRPTALKKSARTLLGLRL